MRTARGGGGAAAIAVEVGVTASLMAEELRYTQRQSQNWYASAHYRLDGVNIEWRAASGIRVVRWASAGGLCPEMLTANRVLLILGRLTTTHYWHTPQTLPTY